MAGEVSYLFERSDFAELITSTGDENGIGNPGIVEKDYFVTEALRLIARDFGDVVIFKGGSSSTDSRRTSTFTWSPLNPTRQPSRNSSRSRLWSHRFLDS